MSIDIDYRRVTEEHDLEDIGSKFCVEHGDDDNGIIPDSEYDQLYDHLGSVTQKHASYSDDAGDADFKGSRYVDQIPWITLVASKNTDPADALLIALETVQSAHRPLLVDFDFYPEKLMIIPPNIVYSTFDREKLISKANKS